MEVPSPFAEAPSPANSAEVPSPYAEVSSPSSPGTAGSGAAGRSHGRQAANIFFSPATRSKDSPSASVPSTAVSPLTSTLASPRGSNEQGFVKSTPFSATRTKLYAAHFPWSSDGHSKSRARVSLRSSTATLTCTVLPRTPTETFRNQ